MAREIAVIGGGAAGMTAAIAAAEQGARVTVYESGVMPGKKLLATGNGKCNFTNRRMKGECFRGGRAGAAMETIRGFNEKSVIAWFRCMGVQSCERNGYLYPRSEQASTVREALVREMEARGVRVLCQSRIVSLAVRPRVCLTLEDGRGRTADAVILAVGGQAAPRTGSDGNGFRLAEGVGHKIIPPVPALVPLRSPEPFCRRLHGVRAQGRITLMVEGRKQAVDTGEIQMTEYGISGIPVFQVSRYASYALLQNKKVVAEIDFLPDWSREEWDRLLTMTIRDGGHHNLSLYSFLKGLFPEKLCRVMLSRLSLPGELAVEKLSQAPIQALTKLVRHFTFRIQSVGTFEQAQATAGGVSTREIDMRTMRSRLHPELYFAGEIVDVDGICGGYNLQWAWSSGWIAGINAARGGEL